MAVAPFKSATLLQILDAFNLAPFVLTEPPPPPLVLPPPLEANVLLEERPLVVLVVVRLDVEEWPEKNHSKK